MNILLLGYYGYNNIGDDLFVKQLVDFLSPICNSISVICNDNYYKNYYPNSTNITFYRSEDLSKFKRIALILRHDWIAWGGGTLLLNKDPKNLILIQRLSAFFRKQFGFLGVGLEGANFESSQGTKKIFKWSDFLCLRDTSSYELAQKTFPDKQIYLGGDLAFLNLDFYQPFVKSDKRSTIENISFSGKHWWGKSRAEFYAQPLLKLIEKYNTKIHLLPGKVGADSSDNAFHERMMPLLPKENCILHSWETPEDFLSILSGMDFHIGNRLHSIILADILGVPNIGINATPPKIRAYIQKTGLLVEARTAEFMEEIPLEKIEQVFQEYTRLDTFIEEESAAIRNSLKNIFGM